jgi:hypothetical protein
MATCCKFYPSLHAPFLHEISSSPGPIHRGLYIYSPRYLPQSQSDTQTSTHLTLVFTPPPSSLTLHNLSSKSSAPNLQVFTTLPPSSIIHSISTTAPLPSYLLSPSTTQPPKNPRKLFKQNSNTTQNNTTARLTKPIEPQLTQHQK